MSTMKHGNSQFVHEVYFLKDAGRICTRIANRRHGK